MAECWCNDTKKRQIDECVVCHRKRTKLMDEHTRKRDCPSHSVHLFFCCGIIKHLCDSCVENGWVSNSGTGGGDALFNNSLKLKIVGNRLLALNERIEEEES